MAKGRKKEPMTPEERLQAALVPESEQPYPMPKNWICFWFTSLIDIEGGTQPPKSQFINEYREGYIRLVQIRDFASDKYIVFVPDTDKLKHFNKDDILIARYGASLGRICTGMSGAYNVALAKTIFSSNILNRKYVYWMLQSESFQAPLMGISRTAQAGFNKEDLSTFAMPLPPTSEQQRIVDRIESLFAKLDEARQKAQDALDSFETRKAAILHKAFTGELTAQWRKGHGVGMESWETHELVECFEIVSGIQKTPARSPKDNPIPYLAVANVYRDKIDLSDIRYFEVTPEEIEKLKLQDKDILIVEGNGSGNEIGRCAMWHNELPLCIHQNHIIRMRNKTADVLPEYVLYYLNSQAGRSVMQERAKTTAGLYNLSAGKVKTIPLAFASLDEQIEIVRILDDLLVKEQQAKEAAEGVLDQIDLIQKAILARAFRGELGTNDPNEESAAEWLKQMG